MARTNAEFTRIYCSIRTTSYNTILLGRQNVQKVQFDPRIGIDGRSLHGYGLDCWSTDTSTAGTRGHTRPGTGCAGRPASGSSRCACSAHLERGPHGYQRPH